MQYSQEHLKTMVYVLGISDHFSLFSCMQHLLHLTVAPYSVLLDPVAFFFFSLPQPLCAKTLAFLFNRRLCRQSSKVCPVIGFLYPHVVKVFFYCIFPGC